MTPAARLAATIEILDDILAGAPAERTLTNWARSRRFAGSGDRAAIRDHVYDALRCKGSFAAIGGEGGRGLVLGMMRANGQDPREVFTGQQYAPSALTQHELEMTADAVDADLDWPEWMRDRLRADLGDDYTSTTASMRQRAPVFLRVNVARQGIDVTRNALADEGITTLTHPLSSTALQVVEGARKIAGSESYRNGLVELQDVSSQASMQAIAIAANATVLDYCAGGGGKSLALAALHPQARVTAHDIDAGRMVDLPQRAARAGVHIERTTPLGVQGQYDVVLVDAPCSGSGTWRRTPDAKWRLTPQRLDELTALQAEILETAGQYLAPNGRLVYTTCSLFRAENEDRVKQLCDDGWTLEAHHRYGLLDGGDGFFAAILHR